MATVEAAKADQAKSAAITKPEAPNKDEYEANLEKAKKEHQAAEKKFKEVKAKLDSISPKNQDSPTAKRQQELKAELQGIRTKQQSSKSGRTQILDRIKRLDETLKGRISESKNARGKVQFKSADDVQAEIDRIQKDVDSGKMKIVDEKKALAEISQLNRTKKSFANFDEAQKGIDTVKTEIAELKKQLDDPESKALSERYTQIQTELDKIRAEQDEAFKNINALRDQRTKLHAEQQEKWLAIKELSDQFYSQKRAAVEYEREARRIREEKRRTENEAYNRGRRQEAAKERLEDASAPAYFFEIRTTQSLLAHFDPSSVTKPEQAGLRAFAAAPSRTVDASGIKGTALKKKGDDDDDNYFVGGGGKKKKGGRRGTPVNGAPSPAPESGKFNLDVGTLESFSKVGVEPPMSQADVPTAVEKLKEKLDFWKKDQDRKTKENVENATKEIEKLEAEAQAAEAKERSTETARKPAAQKQQVNGSAHAGAETEQEKDAAVDVAEDLEKAKIEDETAPEGAA